MAIGDRIRIISEEEYRIMSPPRRPRGEKPQTTIRYLQRQIANMEQELANMRTERQASYARHLNTFHELRDARNREAIITDELNQSAEKYGALLAVSQQQAINIAYLEGYYYAATNLMPHDKAQTLRINAGDKSAPSVP